MLANVQSILIMLAIFQHIRSDQIMCVSELGSLALELSVISACVNCVSV